MKTRTVSFVVLLALAFGMASCGKEGQVSSGISFKAQSSGFMGQPSATKTSYSGDTDEGRERIDWVEGDLIRIYSDQAAMQEDASNHYCDYNVTEATPSGAVSSATVNPSSSNGLQWGSGTHAFYAMYPSPSTSGLSGASFNAGTMTFPMPATQGKTPDMKYAPMLAVRTGVSADAGSVQLIFTPQYTAFEFTVSKSSYETVNLTAFTLTAATGNLAGTFTVPAGDYASVSGVTDGSQTLTVDLTGTTLDSTHESLTFTVLGLPQTVSGLTIQFSGSFDGEVQTRRLTLKEASGDPLSFLPYKKYRISGLSFPAFIDVTAEGIDWDYSLDILDGVTWWLGADQDENVNWEQIDHLALSSEADEYLWRTQTCTRTVSAVAADGQVFSDVAVRWSATPAGVVTVDPVTGEVRAAGPGQATVTATATPNDGTTPAMQASYTVYVNAPTAITLTANGRDYVGLQEALPLTATLTFTSYGTIPSDDNIPSDMLLWTSDHPEYITVTGNAPDKTGIASGVATGITEGASTLTVSVASIYADNLSASLVNFQCDDRTDVFFPEGDKYLFRGYYLHPGVLFWDGSSLSLTSGADPLELLQYYGVSSNPWVNPCYHSWIDLASRLGTDDNGVITGTVSATLPGSATSDNWRIPTGGRVSDVSEWHTIYTGNPSHAIYVNGETHEEQPFKQDYYYVNVDLTGSSYEGRGLLSIPSNAYPAGSVQFGTLLIPDGARVVCSRLDKQKSGPQYPAGGSDITYDDLLVLVQKGCVFVPYAGIYSGDWNMSTGGDYWSATPDPDSPTTKAIPLQILANSTDVGTGYYKGSCMPVRMIREAQ